MNIGTQIQKIRRKNNISQGQLAKDCGITQTYLSLIEHNKKDPNISLLKVITAKLNIPLSLLLLMSLDKEDISGDKSEFFNEIAPEISPIIISLLLK